MASNNDLAASLAAALQPSMVAMAAAIVGVLQPQSAPAQSGSAAAVAINVDAASSHPGPAAAPPAAAGAPADQRAGPAPQGGHCRRPRSRSRRADSPPIPPPTAEQQQVDALSRQLAAVQQQLAEAQAEIARLRSAGGWLQRPARAPPSRPNPQPDQPAARPAAPERRPDGGCGWTSWTNHHNEVVQWYVHARPCTCKGVIPRGPPNPYKGGAPWDPSVQACQDTRPVACTWAMGAHGTSWLHGGRCEGRAACEARRPPAPKDLPPPTYTAQAWLGVPRDERAAVGAAVRASLGLAEGPQRSPPPSSGDHSSYAAAMRSRTQERPPAQQRPQPQRVVGGAGGAAAQARPASGARPRVVVQPAPQRPGTLSAPLQPTPEAPLRIYRGAPRVSAVQPARNWREADFAPLHAEGIREIAAGKAVGDWPVPDQPSVFSEVGLLGLTLAGAHARAAEILQTWPQVGAVSAVILVQRAGRGSCSVPALLRAAGRERNTLDLSRAALHCQAVPERGAWQCETPEEVDPCPPGHVLRLQWRRVPEGDGDDAAMGAHEGAADEDGEADPPPPEGDNASMQAVRLAVCANPALLIAHGESAWARSWVRERVQAFLAPLVAPVDAAQLPLTVAQRGSVYEAATALPHAQAAAALRASGKVLGVMCRPWQRGEESPVPSRMLWLTLPAASRAPLPELWKRLTEQPQLGSFGGLMEGDSAGRVGVRLFGTGPIESGIRDLVGEALDAAVPPPRIIVRVGGYAIGFGLAFGNFQAIRGEIPKVFGDAAGNVRVVSCTHLTATGQERPKFDVTLEGVDEGWPGKTLAPADSRLLPKTWEVRGLTRVRHTYRAVGRTAQVRPPPQAEGQAGEAGGSGADAPMDGVVGAAAAGPDVAQPGRDDLL